MRTYICSSDHPMSKDVTTIIGESSKDHFGGWSYSFDEQFAQQATYARLAKSPSDAALAVLRIIHREHRGVRGPLPMEVGRPRICIPEDGGVKSEISGLWACNMEMVIKIVHDVIPWLDAKTDVAYAIYNPQDAKTSRLIVGMMGFKALPGKMVSYPSITDKMGNTLWWQIARADQSTMREAHQRLDNLLGPSCPVVDMDLA